jgi:hypothetical protein
MSDHYREKGILNYSKVHKYWAFELAMIKGFTLNQSLFRLATSMSPDLSRYGVKQSVSLKVMLLYLVIVALEDDTYCVLCLHFYLA